VLCAEYDPSRAHGHVTWKTFQDIPVIELVNNWICASFAESYRPPLVDDRIAHVLRALRPDIIHVHNLLNLSFDLPAIAHRHGVPVVATLHDYALVCPSGGQRLHRADAHVCREIDTDRCVRCFRESPFFAQISFGRIAAATRAPHFVRQLLATVARRFRGIAGQAAARARVLSVARADIDERLAVARRVFEAIDLFVAPSPSIASEFVRLGMPAAKVRVSDYGFVPLIVNRRRRSRGPLRIGYVGTLVWHKGVHVLIEAVQGLPHDACELKIFGDPEVFPDYTARLRRQADGAPVEFMGAFDRDRTAQVYEQIDVLVVPSLWLENSPLVIHEAFMAGVPVVGAHIGGIAGLVTDGVSGLLYEPESAGALRAALLRLIEQPSLVERLIAGVPKVKPIAQDAKEWERVYEEIVGRRESVAEGLGMTAGATIR
jgi:glycosyltransferase involved in cell wall biosynthesis